MGSLIKELVRNVRVLPLMPFFLLSLVGCASLPPTVSYEQPRRGITPRSSKMKIALFNFIDQTGSAGKLVETLPDMLATELFATQRFEMKERAELRAVDPQQTKDIGEEYKTKVDVLVVGSITRFSVEDKTMTIDVRAYNATFGTVMFAGHFDVHYSGVLDVKAERKDIVRIAEALYAAFPVLGGDLNVSVVGVSGGLITINLGEKDGVKTGMGALVVARGDTLVDPVSGEELANDVYVAEVYIIEVNPKTSKAQNITNASRGLSSKGGESRLPLIKLNDSVRFK